MDRKMAGKFTFNRRFGVHHLEPTAGFEVVDAASGVTFLAVELTGADFLNALFGLARVPCEFELNAAHIGKRREVGQHPVWVTKRQQRTADGVREALAPHETDGWAARGGDVGNRHRRLDQSAPAGQTAADGDWFDVTFIRFVEG